ncbi:MAG: acyltransferase [Candidatus Dormibacteraceae bacterium]
MIRIGAGTGMGGYCTVSAVNRVHIHESVLFGPRVWVTDHNHVYSDISRPIIAQGWTSGGGVDIEEGCWIAAGAVIIGSKPLRIGRGSVVGANSVVTSDVPAYSVVGGNPARILRRYDPATATWQRVDE